ncbi:hypothetical protein BV25DRAFT_1880277 [Artomyces pyxidatus]|uniref:Uncharacterized protein n=1 Tax=Artomyces pyxidatus TaxID=48021 RepID=A0ACB8TBL0_9AGAM|nr:hypothetical protein BV25DRAFT_1880277 [Artomyces pyxidatus]
MVSSNDVNKLFLQAVLSRRLISTDLGKVLWKKAIQAVQAVDDNLQIPYNGTEEGWGDFVGALNTTLNPLDLELSRLHDENTGIEMYALVNRKGDEVAQLASDYSPLEIAYFKALVEQIMLAPNASYSISSLAALRESSTLKSAMSKTQAETVLASFVTKGWLHKSLKGRYSLATRTLLELLPYLKSTYPDEILECVICYEILTRGKGCYTPNCNVRIHDHCHTKYRQGNSKCPSCQHDWASETNAKKLIWIGEKAAGADDPRRRARRRSTVDGSDDEDDEPSQSQAMDDDETPEPTQTQRNKRSKAKRSASVSQADETMEVDEDEEEEAPRPRRSGRRG